MVVGIALEDCYGIASFALVVRILSQTLGYSCPISTHRGRDVWGRIDSNALFDQLTDLLLHRVCIHNFISPLALMCVLLSEVDIVFTDDNNNPPVRKQLCDNISYTYIFTAFIMKLYIQRNYYVILSQLLQTYKCIHQKTQNIFVVSLTSVFFVESLNILGICGISHLPAIHYVEVGGASIEQGIGEHGDVINISFSEARGVD